MSQITLKEGDKLYIVVRKDISSGLQLAQTVHAAFAFSQEYPDETKAWMTASNYIAVLNCYDEQALIYLVNQALIRKIKFSFFRESDMDDQITAVALEAGMASKELCKLYPLALKSKKNN